jgi:hypothetical protein
MAPVVSSFVAQYRQTGFCWFLGFFDLWNLATGAFFVRLENKRHHPNQASSSEHPHLPWALSGNVTDRYGFHFSK